MDFNIITQIEYILESIQLVYKILTKIKWHFYFRSPFHKKGKTCNSVSITSKSKNFILMFIKFFLQQCKSFKSMLSKSSNIVKIDFDLKNGLILKWNFNGRLNPCYYRHILILDVTPEFQSQELIKSYYKKIKLGDIIASVYINELHKFTLSRWRQKTLLSKLQPNKSKTIMGSLNELKQLLALINDRHEDFTEPTMFSIVTQRENSQLSQLQNYLVDFVSLKSTYCANVFCHAPTSIDVSTGVNMLDLDDFAYENSWDFLRLYWSQIALLKAKITITCQNGSISAQNHSVWKTIDFNQIQRELRMPTINYEQDVIHFVQQSFSDKVNYILRISLEYQELNNQSYKAQKIISISSMNEKFYSRTFMGNDSYEHVEIYQTIHSTKNPFYCEAIVLFKKNPSNNSQCF